MTNMDKMPNSTVTAKELKKANFYLGTDPTPYAKGIGYIRQPTPTMYEKAYTRDRESGHKNSSALAKDHPDN